MSAVKPYLIRILFSLLAAFAPIQSAATCAIVFPLVDLLLALLVSFKSSRPPSAIDALRRVRSSGIKRTVAKTALYLAGLLLAYSAETWLGVPFATRVVSVLIGSTELKSCLEHLDELAAQPLFKTALAKLSPPQREEDFRKEDS